MSAGLLCRWTISLYDDDDDDDESRHRLTVLFLSMMCLTMLLYSLLHETSSLCAQKGQCLMG